MVAKLEAWQNNKTAAHVLPFIVFLLFLQLVAWVEIDNTLLPWYRHSPEQWVYPLQTVVVACLLLFFHKQYRLEPLRGFGFATLTGLAGIALWILPSFLFDAWGWNVETVPTAMHYLGFRDRAEGFDPSFFRDQPQWYWLAIAARFLRMVVIVAFVEEIFWRGFVMRLLVDWHGDYWKVPFGAYTPWSLVLTSVLIMLVHQPADYAAALLWGFLGCWTAIRTKSLAACIWMHALANLILGIYVMRSENWGLW